MISKISFVRGLVLFGAFVVSSLLSIISSGILGAIVWGVYASLEFKKFHQYLLVATLSAAMTIFWSQKLHETSFLWTFFATGLSILIFTFVARRMIKLG